MGSRTSLQCLQKNGQKPVKPVEKGQVQKISRKCKICFISYDFAERFPMMLRQCGHTFCRVCAEALDRCALCKEPTNAGQLIKNYEVMEYEEGEQDQHKEQARVVDVTQKYSAPVLKTEANQLLADRQYAAALQSFNRYLCMVPKDYVAANNKGRCLTKLGRFDQARQLYSKLILKRPNQSSFYKNLGICQARTGDHKQAVENFTKALSISKKGKYHNNRAFSYVHLKQYDMALADMTEAITLSPQQLSYYSYRGKIYKKIGRIEEAKADFIAARQSYDAGDDPQIAGGLF